MSGFYITPSGRRGFVQDLSGSYSRTVEFPGSAETQLFALSDHGLVGGAYWDSAGAVAPFLYNISTETFTTLPKPTPGDNYLVSSVNGSGDAIVFGLGNASEFYRDVSSYVFDASEGVLTPLNVPGALETYGYDLRDDGSVLGYYQNPDGSFGGFRAFAVPEPTTIGLLSTGFALWAVAAAWRRRRGN
ncbi:MAG: PEP-CTERM sorting domain-containing protein [Isosphaeraceae bacterium]|nr:PEP-CTERM sorting domain-containing protein [Isosphaeraceae bacterium]